MHNFPERSQLEFLLEAEPSLTRIAIDPYQVSFHLDNGCSVVSGFAVTYVDEAGTEHDYGCEWRAQSAIAFHSLLEEKLLEIERRDLELALVFDHGRRIRVHSELGIYESGLIETPNGFIVF